MRGAAADVDGRILEVLRLKGPQTMESVMRALPDVTWAQVFSSVDRLSRSGKVILQQTPYRDYLIGLRAPFLPAAVLARRITARKDVVASAGPPEPSPIHA